MMNETSTIFLVFYLQNFTALHSVSPPILIKYCVSTDLARGPTSCLLIEQLTIMNASSFFGRSLPPLLADRFGPINGESDIPRGCHVDLVLRSCKSDDSHCGHNWLHHLCNAGCYERSWSSALCYLLRITLRIMYVSSIPSFIRANLPIGLSIAAPAVAKFSTRPDHSDIGYMPLCMFFRVPPG
jgi:hypothetical protein